MAETIPGGAYLASDGKTWHDAEGRPLSKDAQAQAEQLAAEKEESVHQLKEQEAAAAAMQQTALARALLGSAQATVEGGQSASKRAVGKTASKSKE